MQPLAAICDFLESFAPARLAEDWDNVGLLVGDRAKSVAKVMTCLTITPSSAREAIDSSADLIVAHHPLPFRPLKRLTADTTAGRLLLDLIGAGVAIYSPHTAFDSARSGINQSLAEGLGLQEIQPLLPTVVAPEIGSGRWGRFASTAGEPARLNDLLSRLKNFLRLDRVQVVSATDRAMERVAVACGSAGQFLEPAHKLGCDALITGETNFHTCLEAEATGVALLLTGHFASERFGVERLAEVLSIRYPELTIWASRNEQDPLRWS